MVSNEEKVCENQEKHNNELKETPQPTSAAETRFRGSYNKHLLNKFKVSVDAAVNRSRRGVLGNCPTGT